MRTVETKIATVKSVKDGTDAEAIKKKIEEAGGKVELK